MGSTSTIIQVPAEFIDAKKLGAAALPKAIMDLALNLWGGHDPYYNEPKMASPVPGELSYEAIDAIDSGRYTPIVPVMKDSEYELKQKTVSVKLSGEQWEHYRHNSYFRTLHKMVVDCYPEFQGKITSAMVERPEDDKRKIWDTPLGVGWKLSYSIQADTSGGKAKQMFALKADGRSVSGIYETQAQARAAGMKMLEENNNIMGIVVTSKTVREDGSDLVSLQRKVRSASARINFSYAEVKTSNPEVKEYWVSIRHRD